MSFYGYLNNTISATLPPSTAPAVPLFPSQPSTPGGLNSSPPSSSPTSNTSNTPRTFRKPSILPGQQHTYSYLQGKCGNPSCTSDADGPRWSSKKGFWFMICKRYKKGCKWYRQTRYQDPPTIVTPSQFTQTLPGTNSASTTTTLSTLVTRPCVHNPCSTKNIRTRSEKCSNAMCKKDCILHGTLDCRHPEHRKAQGQHRNQVSGSSATIGYTQQPINPTAQPTPVVQYPSLPPSLLSSSSSANPSTQPPTSPPSSPNPVDPLDLSQITQSTVQPYPGTPFPKPTAAPQQEAPVFAQIRYYARILPEEWASQVAAQQAQRASQMATVKARFSLVNLK